MIGVSGDVSKLEVYLEKLQRAMRRDNGFKNDLTYLFGTFRPVKLEVKSAPEGHLLEIRCLPQSRPTCATSRRFQGP